MQKVQMIKKRPVWPLNVHRRTVQVYRRFSGAETNGKSSNDQEAASLVFKCP